MQQTTRYENPVKWSSHDMLGMRLDYAMPKQYISSILDDAAAGRRGYCCVSNVHMCVLAHDDPSFRQVVNGASIVIPDSTILQRARSIRYGIPHIETMRGAEIMEALCARAATAGIPVAFIGGADDMVLAKLKAKAEAASPGLQIVFAYSPPFRQVTADEDQAVTLKIRESGARLIFVGLGCPKQERWMADHTDRLDAMLIGVGAAFDFNSGNVQRSPAWVHRAGLEWLYRLVKEPRRLWKRYATTSPRFVWLMAKDRLKNAN